MTVHLCAFVCALPWALSVHHPPTPTPTPHTLHAQLPGCKNLTGFRDWPEPGAASGHCGRGGGLGGGPCRSHSRPEQGGQGSPSAHPSDLCVHCLPAHPRGAAGDVAASLAGQARRSKSQGPVICQLSGGCKELSNELQHARTHGADRLLPGPRVMVEGVWALLRMGMGVSSWVFVHLWIIYICP